MPAEGLCSVRKETTTLQCDSREADVNPSFPLATSGRRGGGWGAGGVPALASPGYAV